MTTTQIKPSMTKSSSPESEKRSSTKSDSRSKMHKRSRSGCFTCRLRRKKCDEGTPVCRACRHLGVECEYKRPSWWQHAEKRKQHKETIKDIIRNTKQSEKPSQKNAHPVSIDTPPSLCHSLPTSDAHSDMFAGTRAASVDSHFSPQFDIGTPRDMFNSTPMMPPPQWTPMQGSPSQFASYYSPFEVEIKTESHMLVNDMPTQKDSVISTFTAFQQPPMSGSLPSLPSAGVDSWMNQELLDNHNDLFKEEPLNFDFFDYPHAPFSPTHQATIGVEDCDKHLLDHFLENISRLVFPILDANQHSTALNDIILPALESNKCYLHCCLSTAAVHMKATGQIPSPDIDIDTDIMRHRYATISSLCEAFERDSEHSQTLEATLGLILFQTSVGSPDDGLPDIPWHQHLQAAHSLIEKLGLMQADADLTATPDSQHVSFNTSLTSWIDILGATMLCRVPAFSDSYRRKIEGGIASGMAELMGCDDRVMYMISEIACLESLKQEGQLENDAMLCDHIRSLGMALSATEAGAGEVGSVYSTTGAIRPKQLSVNITAAFRLAARIYLCSLVPDFARDQPSVVGLVDQLNDVWQHIPSGTNGFDRSLVWPLLIGGAASIEHSAFRHTYFERLAALENNAAMGSFGRMNELLSVVWDFNDTTYADGERIIVHWRDVMQQKGWECLLI